MSSGHCTHCGAMSTIWLPTCVFCGNSLSDEPGGPPALQPRSQSVIKLALAEQPAVGAPSRTIKDGPRKCTSRVYRAKPRSEGILRSFFAFFARLIPRPNVIRR